MNRDRFLNIPPLTVDEVPAPSAVNLVNTMITLDTMQRFQTPSQLLDAIRDTRQDLEGKARGKAGGPKTLFLIEKDERLQDVLRDKLKELGFRVLIAADPQRALDRFRQQPFDLAVVDAGTAGEEAMLILENILLDADRKHIPCAGVLMLNQDQESWKDKLAISKGLTILVQPIKLKQLLKEVQKLAASS